MAKKSDSNKKPDRRPVKDTNLVPEAGSRPSNRVPGDEWVLAPKRLADAGILSGLHRGCPKTATTRGRIGRRNSATGCGRDPLGS